MRAHNNRFRLSRPGISSSKIRSRLSLWCFPDTTRDQPMSCNLDAISRRRRSPGRIHGDREVRRKARGRGSSPVRCGPDQGHRFVPFCRRITSSRLCSVSSRLLTSSLLLSLQPLLLTDLLNKLFVGRGFQPTLPGDRDQGALTFAPASLPPSASPEHTIRPAA